MFTIATLLAQVHQAPPDFVSGNAGWAGAGLLGLVLAWLMFWHLPAKDKQITEIIATKDKQIGEIMAAQELEREKDRTERHDRASNFQKAINDQYIQHTADAEKDRLSFMARSESLGKIFSLAIEKQTLELQKAIKDSCRYYRELETQNGRPSPTGLRSEMDGNSR